MAIPKWWERIVHPDDKREKRQWIKGEDESAARRTAAKLRKQVAEFKAEASQQSVAFRTDRDAWEVFKQRHRGAVRDFTGNSVDAALDELAFKKWQRLWNSGTKIVRFEGDGIISAAPAIGTLDEGERRARFDVLEVLKSTDAELRARTVASLRVEVRRLEKDIEGRRRRIQYYRKVDQALESGATAIEKAPGEYIVQGMLPAPEPAEELEDGDTE